MLLPPPSFDTAEKDRKSLFALIDAKRFRRRLRAFQRHEELLGQILRPDGFTLADPVAQKLVQVPCPPTSGMPGNRYRLGIQEALDPRGNVLFLCRRLSLFIGHIRRAHESSKLLFTTNCPLFSVFRTKSPLISG